MKTGNVLVKILGSVALLLGASNALSQQSIPLVSSGLLTNDQFGVSVAVGQNYAVVGANQRSDNGSHPGKAYVFRRTEHTWEQEAIISAGSGFGISVAIEGSTVVVGAFEEVFVFEHDGTNWIQRACLTPSTPQHLAFFGSKISMTSNRIVVGAQGDGAVYIFDRPSGGWTSVTESARLSISDSDSFGSDVAVYKENVLIGARGSDAVARNSGAGYVYELAGSNWVQTSELVGSTLEQDCYSGESVALSENYAFIGGHGGYQPARVYVFEYSGTNWIEIAILQPDIQWFNRFSTSIDVDEPFALIGDPRDGSNAFNGGAAHLYILSTADTWQSWGLLPAAAFSSDVYFGQAVGIYSNSAFVGAPRADDLGSDSGSCYAYDLTSPRQDLRFVQFANINGTLDMYLENLTYDSTIIIETSQELLSSSWTEFERSTITDPGVLLFHTNFQATGEVFFRAFTHAGINFVEQET